MTNPKTTEFVIRMYADQIAEGTYFSMVDLNDSTLNSRYNIESYFADVFYDTFAERFAAPGSTPAWHQMDGESFADHVAGLVMAKIDLEKFIDEVQLRVTSMLVQQARKNSKENDVEVPLGNCGHEH